MPVCHKRKLAFCHIPRTGGVSVTAALEMEVPDRHFKASWYRKNFPNYKLFTIVRDYDDRIRSAFGWKLPEVRKEEASTLQELVDLIKSRGENNVSLMLQKEEYFLDVEPDFKLRFTNLQGDINTMLQSLGFNTVIIPQTNSFR